MNKYRKFYKFVDSRKILFFIKYDAIFFFLGLKKTSKIRFHSKCSLFISLTIFFLFIQLSLPFLSHSLSLSLSFFLSSHLSLYIYIYIYILFFSFFPFFHSIPCPVGWGCRIYRLHLCRGADPPLNECPGYETKHFDGEVPVMLGLWKMRSIPSLSSPPGTRTQSGSTR